MTDKSLILSKIKDYKNFKNDSVFAHYLGISRQNLSKWKSRKTYDIDILFTKIPELNAEWLITGEGEMLKTGPIYNDNQNENAERDKLISTQEKLIQYQEEKIQDLEKTISIKNSHIATLEKNANKRAAETVEK